MPPHQGIPIPSPPLTPSNTPRAHSARQNDSAESVCCTVEPDPYWTFYAHPKHDLNRLILSKIKKSPGTAGALHFQNCRREAW